jgi:hypothetical protein
MNAWVDCMSCINEGMTRFSVAKGELFHLGVAGTEDFARRLPEIFQAFIESAAFVNWRRIENGEPPLWRLFYFDCKLRNVLNHSCLANPKSSMSLKDSPTHQRVQRAMTRTSIKS